MKQQMVPLTVVAVCLGLPSLALSRPREDPRADGQELRDQRRKGREETRGSNEAEDGRRRPNGPEGSGQPPPGAPKPTEQNDRAKYQEHLRQHQEAARVSHKAARQDPKAWSDGRSQRAESHRREIAQTFGNLTDTPEAKVELATHADRMARLNRALDIAEGNGDTSLVNRINDLIQREIARDAQAISTIKAKAGVP